MIEANPLPLLPTLKPGQVILTPNRRLSVYLREYNAAEHSLAPTPAIYPLDTWLIEQWQSLIAAGHCTPHRRLEPAHIRALWLDIIHHSEHLHGLQDASRTAQLAMQAWQTLKQWQVSPDSFGHNICDHQQHFQQWSAECDARCKTFSALTITEIAQVVASQAKHLSTQTIFYVGFDNLPPYIQSLFAACAEQGITVEAWDVNRQCAQTQRLGLADSNSELRAMAHWAKHYHHAHPTHRIACIVPDLQNLRPKLARYFRESFHPEKILQPQGIGTMHYNLAGGESLNTFPLIQTALTLIAGTTPEHWPNFQAWVTSPFLSGAEEESSARAQLTQQLRQKFVKPPELTILADHSEALCPALSRLLREQHQRHTSAESLQQPASQWRNWFLQALAVAGWPGDAAVDSQSYQIIKQFYAQLDDLCRFDWLYPAISFQQAEHLLKQAIYNNPTQIQSEQAQVQVLGILEATGINFDAIWIMGLHQDVWPAPAKPNPFIPAHLQRSLQMPHASSLRELDFSKKVMQRLQRSTRQLICSYPMQDGDRSLSPSQLIAEFSEVTWATLCPEPISSRAKQLLACAKIETLVDAQAAPIVEAQTLLGGSYSLKQQILCPFSGFAKSRLQASVPEPLTLGLNALERGLLIHDILEHVWQTYPSLKQLRAARENSASWAAFVDDCIQRAWHALDRQTQPTLLKQVEFSRSKQLLEQWLDLECQRPDFSVLATELRCDTQYRLARFSCKIDRIDQTSTGEVIIIDYKTGQPTPRDWFSEPAFDIQMPLYAQIYRQQAVQAISFAQLNPKQLTFKGVSEVDLQIDGVVTLPTTQFAATGNDWTTQLISWQQQIHHALDGWLSGDARVAPLHPEKACQRCDLQSLCRINEQEHSV